MKISVARPGELGPVELARWRRLQHENPNLANPFLSPEFTLCIARVHQNARVAVLEEGAQIVGFFPYQRGALRIGKPIGAGVSDCQGLIHAAGLEWDPRALLRACGLDIWEFDHLLADQLPFRPYHVVRDRSLIMNFGDGYEAYLADRRRASKRAVDGALRKRRKLDREAGIRFDFDAQHRDLLHLLMRWKSAQYRRNAWPDRFARPWIVQLVEDLFETRAPGCSGTLSALYAGGRPVAAHFGPRSESVLSSWFPAYDVEFSRYSPGLVLHFEMAEAASASGLRHLDLGKGQEGYKELLGNGSISLAEGWVERPSPVAIAHRFQRAPRRYAVNFVLRRPALRRSARRVLRRVERLRSSS
jgi:CelD/BcsL family acetyltransferase involved in cellulose biosynthesis